MIHGSHIQDGPRCRGNAGDCTPNNNMLSVSGERKETNDHK